MKKRKTIETLPKFYLQKLRKLNYQPSHSPQTQARPTGPEQFVPDWALGPPEEDE